MEINQPNSVKSKVRWWKLVWGIKARSKTNRYKRRPQYNRTSFPSFTTSRPALWAIQPKMH
jgi:hypothetical protein